MFKSPCHRGSVFLVIDSLLSPEMIPPRVLFASVWTVYNFFAFNVSYDLATLACTPVRFSNSYNLEICSLSVAHH